MRACVLAFAILLLVLASAPRAQQRTDAEPAPLPVRRVVLYKSGVGYFEHAATVNGSGEIAVQFTSAQLNDVLKSFTALDLDGGQIAAISYTSTAPLEQRLASLRLPLGAEPDAFGLYSVLRGARVEVRSPTASVSGRILGIEKKATTRDDGREEIDVLTVVSGEGAVQSVVLTPDVTVRILDPQLREQVGRYLGVIASARDQDRRQMTLSATGTGTRRLRVSYISEVPVWKSTYRLVLPAKADAPALLQGWAIVDNTVGEDWTGVELSLVAGAPHSFIQEISQPYYTRRPVVPLPHAVLRAPQTHDPSLSETVETPKRGIADANQTAFDGGVVGGVGGGRYAPAPAEAPPPSRPASLAAAGELGDLFEYRLSQPVTIRQNQSALVPIVHADVEAQRLSLWNRTGTSGRPLRAVWLTNATRLTLDGGTVSVVDADAFAGEGLVAPLKPGEKRLISYGTDLGVLVDSRLDESSGRYTRITASDGVVVATREGRNRWIYRVRNEDAQARTLVIEHPLRAGWTLAPGQTPAETTASAARFLLPVESKAEARLTVDERHLGTSRISLEQFDEARMTVFAEQGVSIDVLRRALQPVLDARQGIAALERRLADLTSQIDAIAANQQRMRENMKALRGSNEEKALLRRYTADLHAQEDRLIDLQGQIDRVGRDLVTRRTELARLIGELTFDLEPASSLKPEA